VVVEKTGLQLFIMVHHWYHQGPLEQHADCLQQFKDDYARTSPCGAFARFLPEVPQIRNHGPGGLVPHVHQLYAKYDIARLTTDMYLSDLTPAMKPSDAYAHIALHKTERVEIDQLEGRNHGRTGDALSAGIPLLIPGEVFNKKIVDYLKFSREFNAQCPGFETDIHGLLEEVGADGLTITTQIASGPDPNCY